MRKKQVKCFLAIIFLITASNAFINAQSPGLASDAIYILKAKEGDKLLNVNDASLTNSANVNIWTDTNSDAERWILKQVSNGMYTISNVASGYMLNVTGSAPTNGANVNQSANLTSSTVQWDIVDAGDGYYYLKAADNTNLALTLYSGSVNDGANVFIGTINQSDYQKWSLQIQSPQDEAPTAAIADKVFEAWKIKYYDTRSGNEVIKGEGFWGVAEMMEIVVDAYEVTGKGKYLQMFNEMYVTFIQKEGEDWMWNAFNDDITWMVLACTRMHLCSGNQAYLAKAKDQFDKMYARALTNDFGGGLIWKEGILSKNSCINGPAMIACCYLAQATGDLTYYEKAIQLYEWSKQYLFNPNTGKVNDAYDGQVHQWSSTYNQGTYLGASIMLYNYTKDPAYHQAAQKIANYTKNDMFQSGIINSEDGPDLQGFKGIFMRYARKYVVDLNRTDYIPWLQLNAKVAYNNRNSDNIIETIWSKRTSETTTSPAFGASSPVSLLINCPLSTSIIKNAYQTIQSENFNYLKNVIVEPCPDGTDNIGGVQNGSYTVYKNIDFGFKGAASVEFRLSSATSGGNIEIRVGSTNGQLIGTANINGTGNWGNYSTFSAPVVNLKGLRDIYLIYKGSGYLFNINHFKFIEEVDFVESNGLQASYFNGTNFENPVLQRIDNEINFDWNDLSPAAGINPDYYSVRWTGSIEAPHTDTYTFYIKSDNGRRVWINNTLIIDKWIKDWDIYYSGTINLEVGKKYDIKVEYFEEVGGANIKLEWASSQTPREIIPSSQFYLPNFTTSDLEQIPSIIKDELIIYPNPLVSQLHIDYDIKQIKSVTITNSNGIVSYYDDDRSNDNYPIDISNLTRGMYFLVVLNSQNEKVVSKFVKQ